MSEHEILDFFAEISYSSHFDWDVAYLAAEKKLGAEWEQWIDVFAEVFSDCFDQNEERKEYMDNLDW